MSDGHGIALLRFIITHSPEPLFLWSREGVNIKNTQNMRHVHTHLICIQLHLEDEHLSPEKSDGVEVSLTYVGAKGRPVWPAGGVPGCRRLGHLT